MFVDKIRTFDYNQFIVTIIRSLQVLKRNLLNLLRFLNWMRLKLRCMMVLK